MKKKARSARGGKKPKPSNLHPPIPEPFGLSHAEKVDIATEEAQHVSTGGAGYELHNCRVILHALNRAFEQFEDKVKAAQKFAAQFEKTTRKAAK